MTMPVPIDALMMQFLEWLTMRPRTYTDAMEAWRSTCPRHTTWEDALAEGFIEVGGADASSPVIVTACGRSALENFKRPETLRRQ